MNNRLRNTAIAPALALGLLLAGCASAGGAQPDGSLPDVSQLNVSQPNQSPAASVTSSSVTSSSATASPTVSVPTPAIVAPAPNADLEGESVSSAGVVLPNSLRTPGATNASVTQQTINQTICVPGWTRTVRPSSHLTTALKIKQLASGYSYRGNTLTKDYEEDHLISLELGGSPTAEANLWPEPYGSGGGARVKDQLENTLHSLVCSGAISLATAQSAIASNWWLAYGTYVTR